MYIYHCVCLIQYFYIWKISWHWLCTVKHHYNVVKSNTILNIATKWLKWYIHQTLNTQKTPHRSSSLVRCGVSIVSILENIHLVILALHYNAVRCSTLLDIAMQWLRYSIQQTLSSQKTAHSSPVRASYGLSWTHKKHPKAQQWGLAMQCLLGVFWEILTMLKCNCTVIKIPLPGKMIYYILVVQWKTAVSPVCYQWGYCSIVLSHDMRSCLPETVIKGGNK